MEIGGYFGLDLADHGDRFAGLAAFQSGRSALQAVVRAARLETVWIPDYVCDTVIAAAREGGAALRFYEIGPGLTPVEVPARLGPGQALLYVNYFGLCSAQVRALRSLLPARSLIIDDCHAPFHDPGDVLASVLSPRKFAGLPDGGLVRTGAGWHLQEPEEQDADSIDRARFLLRRAGESARAGYAEFDAARRSLNGIAPRRMSALTRRMLRSVDWDAVAAARRRNFAAMHERLAPTNALRWDPAPQDVPLCYPYRVPGCDSAAARERLAAQDIFVPTYWPDALARLPPGRWERGLMDETLFLPIDQRMDGTQVQHVCERVLDTLHDSKGAGR